MKTNNSWAWVVHNLVAHPLMVLWPKVGEWLHEFTASFMDEEVDNTTEPETGDGWAEKTPETIEIENVTQHRGNVVSIDSKRTSEQSIFDQMLEPSFDETTSGFTVRKFK